MSEVTLTVPDDAVPVLELTGLPFGDALKLTAAVKLYEMGRLSAGGAAELAGLPVVVFLSRLAEFNVPAFRQSEAELLEDLRCA
jgi:hypothetical protein